MTERDESVLDFRLYPDDSDDESRYEPAGEAEDCGDRAGLGEAVSMSREKGDMVISSFAELGDPIWYGEGFVSIESSKVPGLESPNTPGESCSVKKSYSSKCVSAGPAISRSMRASAGEDADMACDTSERRSVGTSMGRRHALTERVKLPLGSKLSASRDAQMPDRPLWWAQQMRLLWCCGDNKRRNNAFSARVQRCAVQLLVVKLRVTDVGDSKS